jgi:hypothetical protein
MSRIHRANGEHKSCMTTYIRLPTSAGVLTTLIYSCHVGVRSETAQGYGCIVKAQVHQAHALGQIDADSRYNGNPNIRYVLDIP